MENPLSLRIACDSLVALGNSSADGSVIFAKNSDRPANECQPLALLPRREHGPDSPLRCTYIDIPQVASTARVIGSRPFWCWGFEHGVNEHGVAIGNHTVFTKDALSGHGLIGMDLVRLGLERAHSADEAVQVITALLERYGQGGSGYSDKDWPYHNSFLIADRNDGIVLETSDRNWVLRRATDVASVSNHLAIGSDWDALSDRARSHAVERGWWPAATDRRFDFAAAYRDVSMAPEVISSGRHQRTCALLSGGIGKVSAVSLRAALRDHYGSATPRTDLTPDQPEYFSVCMHADPVGTTTASVIARLGNNPGEPLLYWASLGSPCVGVFLPLFLDCDLPAPLLTGGESPTPDSAWWQFKNLLASIEQDWGERFPRVRTVLDEIESNILDRVEGEGIATAARNVRQSFVGEIVSRVLGTVQKLTVDL